MHHSNVPRCAFMSDGAEPKATEVSVCLAATCLSHGRAAVFGLLEVSPNKADEQFVGCRFNTDVAKRPDETRARRHVRHTNLTSVNLLNDINK